MKLPLPAERVTLADFKGVLQRPSYKFFFKSMDDDFGVVKEEISDDNAKLPCFNGRVVSWLVSAEGSHPEPALSVLTTPQSCLLQWNAQEASVTLGPRPSTLMLVGAARRTWTMTQRPTPWYLPNESGPDGGMALSTQPASMEPQRASGDGSQVAMTVHLPS